MYDCSHTSWLSVHRSLWRIFRRILNFFFNFPRPLVVLSPRKLVREHKSRSSTRIRRDFENPPKTPAYKVKSASIDSSIVFKNSFLDFLHRYQYSHHKTWYVSIRAGVLPESKVKLEIPWKLPPTQPKVRSQLLSQLFRLLSRFPPAQYIGRSWKFVCLFYRVFSWFFLWPATLDFQCIVHYSKNESGKIKVKL